MGLKAKADMLLDEFEVPKKRSLCVLFRFLRPMKVESFLLAERWREIFPMNTAI